MFKVCLVVNCSSINQHYYFLPSYTKCKSGYLHDLIVVHRNYEFIEKEKIFNNSGGNIIFENKIIDNYEIPNKANGSYKYIFEKYKHNYDIFIFMVDHCVIRRDEWILDAINIFNKSDKIGFLGSQIFNGNKRYPHPHHVRNIFVIVRSIALNSENWNFNSDSEGELKLGNCIVENGYIGLQIGNKLNFAYDSLGNPFPNGAVATAGNYNHITHIIENKFFPEKNLMKKFEKNEYNILKEIYLNNLNNLNNFEIISPVAHIGKQNIFIDIEPFNLLIYYPSLKLCFNYFPDKVIDIGNNIYTLDI